MPLEHDSFALYLFSVNATRKGVVRVEIFIVFFS